MMSPRVGYGRPEVYFHEGIAVHIPVAAILKYAAALSADAREKLPSGDFVRPRKGKAESGSYPIPDRAHARAALGFAAMHHGKDSAIYRAVKAKVDAKFGKSGSTWVASTGKTAGTSQPRGQHGRFSRGPRVRQRTAVSCNPRDFGMCLADTDRR